MKIKFIKASSSGNDYVFVCERAVKGRDVGRLAERISNRREGVGSDGLVVLEVKGRTPESRMYNADGSEGSICGNALLMTARLMHGYTGGKRFTVCTRVGERRVYYSPLTGRATADMGEVSDCVCGISRKGCFAMECCGRQFVFYAVGFGNAHAVAFVEHFDFPLSAVAERLCKSGIFPCGVNVEFVRMSGRRADVRVIERGSGETLSCGSGACAVASVLFMRGERKSTVTLQFKGGALTVRKNKRGRYLLSGKPVICFNGEMKYE